MSDDTAIFSIRLTRRNGQPISGRLVIVFLDWWGGVPGPTQKAETSLDGKAQFKTYGCEQANKIFLNSLKNNDGPVHQVLLADRHPISNGATLSFVLSE